MKLMMVALVAVLLCGCGDRKQEARIKELEKRLERLEAHAESEMVKRDTVLDKPVAQSSVHGGVDQVSVLPTAMPFILSVTGRVTEANSIWWKWSTIITIANTNETPAHFDLSVQYLDKDGFVVDSDHDYNLDAPPFSTNKFTGYQLVNLPAGTKIKSFKAAIVQ